MKYRSALQRIAGGLAAGALTVAAGCSGGPARQPQTQTTPAAPPPAVANAVSVVRSPSELPPPITRTTPQTVVVNMETVEVQGQLADGITTNYWTYDGKLPGPMIRVRAGDTVELHLKNNPASQNPHSIDLHAVSGPGGGSVAMMTKPGAENVLQFKTSNPGVFLYHCATPHIPTHIAMGMYGLVVVEPPGGLPPVDREFYIVQGEVYTEGTKDTKGHLAYDGDKLFRESPNYVVFNGKFKGLTEEPTMKVKRGERVRLFVGNAGPNLSSSFHVIGEVFDRVHPEGATETITNVATTAIPAGGAAIVEFKADVAGRFILVDHAISRAIDKGALGYIDVEGDPNPSQFNPLTGVQQGVGH